MYVCVFLSMCVCVCVCVCLCLLTEYIGTGWWWSHNNSPQSDTVEVLYQDSDGWMCVWEKELYGTTLKKNKNKY